MIEEMLQLPIGKPFSGIKISKNKNREMLVSGDVLSQGYLKKNQNKGKFLKIKKKIFITLVIYLKFIKKIISFWVGMMLKLN